MGEWRYNSTIDDERPASRPCRFTPEERAPGIHWIGGWVGPRSGLNAVFRESKPGDLARSPSLYRLSYPDSPCVSVCHLSIYGFVQGKAIAVTGRGGP
jgi:hypothetical protein